MPAYLSYYGIITRIDDFWTGSTIPTGCYKLVSIQIVDGSIVNFVVSPTTYFVDHETLYPGDPVIAFYDAMAPVPLIYPPQYQAIVMAKATRDKNFKVDYFNSQLVSSDGKLKLNISPLTKMLLENNQVFTGNITNRNLIVVYGVTTRSIPAQTTPYSIIVMCRYNN